MKKRILSILMVCCLIITFIPITGKSAYAATILGDYTTLNFSSPKVYDVVATGSYKAEKRKGSWYYKFTKGTNVVYIKCSAFTGNVSNSFSTANQNLTNTINNGNYSSAVSNVAYKTKRTRYNSSLKANEHIYYFAKLKVAAVAPTSGNAITLQTTMCDQVNFTYCNKIRLRSTVLTPSNASHYKAALKRNNESKSMSIIPKFDISIKKTGTKKNYLVSNSIAGKGVATTKANIDKLITIGYKAGVLATTGLSTSTVYNLFKEAVSLQSKGSSEYESRKTLILSQFKGKKYYYCTKATFQSPIKLKAKNDYFEVPIQLDKNLNVKKTKMAVKISHSIAGWSY